MKTLTSRSFNNDVAAAKRWAVAEPVVITDRGTPRFVLMSFEEYRLLNGRQTSIVQALSMEEDVEFDAPKADFSLKTPSL